MKACTICQSCGMPMDEPLVHGTEKNGACSQQYCIYCYKEGQFTHPEMTLEEMKYNVRRRMEEQHLSGDMITRTVDNLQFLKRWLLRPVERASSI